MFSTSSGLHPAPVTQMLLATVALVCSCIDELPSRPCVDDSECVRSKLPGKCTPSPESSRSWCVFQSDDCEHGQWGALAGDDLAGKCALTFDASVPVDGPVFSAIDASTADAAPGVDAADTVELTLSIVGEGTVNVSPPGTSCGANCYSFSPGERVSLIARPAATQRFSQWRGLDCEIFVGDCMLNVTRDTHGVVRFEGGKTVFTKEIVEGEYRLASHADGSYVVAAALMGPADFGDNDVIGGGAGGLAVVRYTAGGAVLWKRFIARTAAFMKVNDVAVASDGHVFVAGAFRGSQDFGAGDAIASQATSVAASDGFVVAFTSAGGDDWVRTMWASTTAEAAIAVASTNGEVTVAGRFRGSELVLDPTHSVVGRSNPPSGESDVFVARIKMIEGPVGVVWSGGFSSAPGASTVSSTATGEVALGTSYRGSFTFAGTQHSSQTTRGIVLVWDSFGRESWALDAGGVPSSVGYDPSGNLYAQIGINLGGGNVDLGAGPHDPALGTIVVAKYGPSKNILWSKNFGLFPLRFAVGEAGVFVDFGVNGLEIDGWKVGRGGVGSDRGVLKLGVDGSYRWFVIAAPDDIIPAASGALWVISRASGTAAWSRLSP